jgi:hypothetical protein
MTLTLFSDRGITRDVYKQPTDYPVEFFKKIMAG